MRCLVTGGAGFIGSHLCEALLRAGEEVVVLDDLSTGSMDNIAHIMGNPSFRFVCGSISDETVVSSLVEECEHIYHLAAAVGVKLIVQSPVRTIETNIHGTEVILRLASLKRRKVLIASSSEVYGKGSKVPFSEDDDMVFGPTSRFRWSYGCSKAIDEFLALSYHAEAGLPVVIARFFNVIGPRQVGCYGMVVPRFVRQAMEGGPITVYGDGMQTRTFLHVEDAVQAVIALMRVDCAVGGVFNVGSEEEISIRELAERVSLLVGGGVRIVHVPYEEAYGRGFEDLRRRVPDVTRLRNATGFRPMRSLDDALRDVWEHESRRQG